MAEHLVIVGAGQAATQAVQTLRQQNYAGAITLLGEEPYAPYQRPPLSKKYFSGEMPRERLLLRPQAFYAEKGIALELGARVEEVDAAAHALRLHDGRALRYDKLLLATGSRPRRLAVPGAELAGVHHVRTIADIDALDAGLPPGARVVVIGGGYIGLEMASVARQRGFAVTVLEAADRVLGRVVCEQVSRVLSPICTAPPASRSTSAPRSARCMEARASTRSRRRTAGAFACDVADRRDRRRAERRARGGRGPRVRERHRRRRARADRGPRRARVRRLHESSAQALRALGSARVGAERGPSGQSRGRDAAREPERVLRDPVVLVRSIRREDADRRAVTRLRHGRAARRPRAEELRGVLPREPAS